MGEILIIYLNLKLKSCCYVISLISLLSLKSDYVNYSLSVQPDDWYKLLQGMGGHVGGERQTGSQLHRPLPETHYLRQPATQRTHQQEEEPYEEGEWVQLKCPSDCVGVGWVCLICDLYGCRVGVSDLCGVGVSSEGRTLISTDVLLLVRNIFNDLHRPMNDFLSKVMCVSLHVVPM